MTDEFRARLDSLLCREFRPRRPEQMGKIYVDEILVEAVANLIFLATSKKNLANVWFDTNSVYHRLGNVYQGNSSSDFVVAPEIVNFCEKVTALGAPEWDGESARLNIASCGMKFLKTITEAEEMGTKLFLDCVEHTRQKMMSLSETVRKEAYH